MATVRDIAAVRVMGSVKPLKPVNRRKPERAKPVSSTTIHPDVLRAAFRLAGGDHGRLDPDPETGAVRVLNRSRNPQAA